MDVAGGSSTGNMAVCAAVGGVEIIESRAQERTYSRIIEKHSENQYLIKMRLCIGWGNLLRNTG